MTDSNRRSFLKHTAAASAGAAAWAWTGGIGATGGQREGDFMLRIRRRVGRAVVCPFLLAAGLVTASAAAGETLTITASQCAGLSGFRAH